MGDMLNEEEVGHLPSLSQSRHEHMHEQYNNFLEDEDHWQDVSDVRKHLGCIGKNKNHILMM